MSWRDKAAAAVKGPNTEPTKPTKGAFVSNVSAPPAPYSPTEASEAPEIGTTDHALERGELIRFPLPATAPAVPATSPLSGYDCNGCDRLEMKEEPQPGTRRRFYWRCRRGHELLEGRNYGSRITLAPPECEEAGDFTPWKAGTQ